MGDEVSASVSFPLDPDGFLRRECPTCGEEFKWFHQEEYDADIEHVAEYFCPLCGVPAATDAWYTTAQVEYMQGAVGPQLDEAVQDAMKSAFSGIKGISFKPAGNFTFGLETPDPLIEPDAMVIVAPPCHDTEPVKVPETATAEVHCLICGQAFSA